MELRLLNEFTDLTRRIAKLECFLDTDVFRTLGNETQELLLKQVEAMHQYHDILFARIEIIMTDGMTVKGEQKELKSY